MQGIYVDTNACLILVYAHALDGNDYSVYLTHGDTTDLAVATTTNKCTVRLEEVDATRIGFYNGKDCIVWDGGYKWRRVEMSAAQYRLLTSRPYVPLSFMAIQILQGVVKSLFTTVTAWGMYAK